MQRRENEHYYGFGERSGFLDKNGRRMRMLNLDALGYNAETGDPLYKHIPFYITYVPELKVAYGLFYDNLSTTVFDMGQEHDNYYGPYRYYQAEAGDLDYYLIFGPKIADVVQKFSKLIGRPALPPRWSLGYLGSSMLYTDAPNAQEELKKFVRECLEYNIPCDMFHLSSGYGSGADGKRYVFNWNFEKIPDPRQMIDTFHQAGMHVAANIKPCLLDTHPRYAEVARLDAFVKDFRPGSRIWITSGMAMVHILISPTRLPMVGGGKMCANGCWITVWIQPGTIITNTRSGMMMQLAVALAKKSRSSISGRYSLT